MKTLIFDFDGTLADSFKVVFEIGCDLLGIEQPSNAEQAELRRMSLRQVLKKLHIPLWKIPSLLVKGRKIMHDRMGEVEPFAGVPEMLRQLQKSGYPMLVISSNSEGNVRSFLRNAKLEQYFEAVYGNVGVFDKSQALRKVLRHRHLEAKDCFYIGDEARDVSGSQRAHVPCISVTWGYQNPEALTAENPFALAHTPVELLEIIQAH